MRLIRLKLIVLSGLALAGAAALADPPAQVGRIAVVQGEVGVRAGGAAAPATLNWPVTGADHITTAPGALAEFRIGATEVRLAGDSDLEIVELDDNLLRLHLHYGSVAVRTRSPAALAGLELSADQARVVLLRPGHVRLDARWSSDATVVGVLSGAAQIEGDAGALTVAAGRRAELRDGQWLTGAARRDSFDLWPEPARAASTRYVSEAITGHEELDEYGAWSDDAEYGPLWAPRSVPADWAPYRDGRWAWVAPWGWTWVDRAPWGYAPSHYGRWVMRRQRWHWAPGPRAVPPVWAPALVGWVGDGPTVGWFPLSPRQLFVPAYGASPARQRSLNPWHGGTLPSAGAGSDARDGLSVLPRAQFGGRHTVWVNGAGYGAARGDPPRPLPLAAAPQPAAPSAYPNAPARPWRGGGRRPDQVTSTMPAPPQAGPAPDQDMVGPRRPERAPPAPSGPGWNVPRPGYDAVPQWGVPRPVRDAPPPGQPAAPPRAPDPVPAPGPVPAPSPAPHWGGARPLRDAPPQANLPEAAPRARPERARDDGAPVRREPRRGGQRDAEP